MSLYKEKFERRAKCQLDSAYAGGEIYKITRMLETKVIVALLVLFVSLVSAHDELSKSHHFPGKKLIFGQDSFANTTLSYAACDIGKDRPETKCSIVREYNVFEGTSKTISCEVTLKVEKPDRLIGSSMKVIPLGENRTIIIWTENDKKDAQNKDTIVRYTTVTFPECKTTQAKLSFARKDDKVNPDSYPEIVQVATYKDETYCLALANDSLCGEKGVCKVHVDPRTDKVEEPKKWFTTEYGVTEVLPVVPHSQEKGHLVIEGMFVNVPQAYIVKTDGQRIKFPSELDSQRLWKLVYSTTYSTIGLCYYSNSTFNCAQYDHEGQPKLKSNPEFGFAVEQTAMYNLRNGGFLLFTSRCESICAMKDDHYYITKFDAQGKKAGEVKLTGFHREALSNLVKAQFFEKQDGVYCVSMVRYDISLNKESGDMLLFAKCFDDKSFK